MFVCVDCGASATSVGPCPLDGRTLLDAGDDRLLGSQIGPYRVARLLGVGGMACVYKGVHPLIGSRVAIKVLSRECSDRPDLVERFFAEAKAVNVIAHENIVNVLDLATLPDGRPYIVMEYLDGAPLSAIIERARSVGPLPLGAIARLAAEVLDALGAAHAKGVIHRDLKPDNIFVSPAGRATVLDFGIAKLHPELGGSTTHTGSLLGTPHYMAPEQAAGKVVDARADLYAIGVILFECVTLQRPFHAAALFDLLRLHIEASPPRPRALRHDLSPEFEAVILQSLAKSPDERFGNATAMSFALQQATASLPPEAWSPLLPAGAVTTKWITTPPASWARSKTPTSHSGTTAAPTRARTRRTGMWLALGAIVMVGGGIAVATFAGGSKPAAVVVTEGSATLTAELVSFAAQAVLAPEESEKPAPTKLGSPKPVVRDPLEASGDLSRPPSISSRPPGFDPKRANFATLLPWAVGQARRFHDDAQLARVDFTGVYPDGHVELGEIDVRFISKSHMKKGAHFYEECEFRVDVDTNGLEIRPMSEIICDTPVPMPKCSLAQIWEMALVQKPDLGNVPANIIYMSDAVSTYRIIWDFEVKGAAALQFADQCGG